MNTTVEWTARGRSEVEALSKQAHDRVVTTVTRLAGTGHGDVKRLKTSGAEFRLRVGQYRVIFESERHPDRHVIRILRVLPRDRAYRDYD